MKLHLPVLLRKALLACFAFSFASSEVTSAADLTLGGDASLTIDYAAANSIPDLAGGTLRLNGDTILLLSNCGVGDGKTYTLLTGVGALLDAEGNPLTLTDVNNAASLYFDTSRPGAGFWADGWLQLASDGSVQIVLHAEDVQEALTITTRQTGNVYYSYYAGISFKNLTTTDSTGGAIYGASITLSHNGRVVFVGNTASSSTDSAWGGAIGGNTITLSNNGSVVFEGNKASGSSNVCGGAIYGATITLSNNGSVVFEGNKASGSSNVCGGAIYGATITLSNNGSVVFEGNKASSSSSSAHGGAIFGSSSTITLSNNGSVVFEGNTASSLTGSAWGGAIDGISSSTITLSNNGSVVFEGNKASSSSSSAHGGAIFGSSSTITLSNNGSVEFEGNTASGSSNVSGGAIYGGSSTITLSNNGSVEFEGNTASGSSRVSGGAIHVTGVSNELIITGNASGQNEDGSAQQLLFENNHTKCTDGLSGAYGGAISADVGSTLKINNNGETIFRGNYASSTQYDADGGAIDKQHGIFSIQNNASVVFEKNYTLRRETLRLQGIYAYDGYDAGEEMVVNFSAPKDGKIEFRDSIYINVASNSASAFHLNNLYENDEGEQLAQTGDIIFTGTDATAENLKAILAVHGINREATADEIRLSKTSEVWGTMQLHDGRLIVRDGAVIEADGITVHDSASGESTPTLWLDNGELSSYPYSPVRKNAISISGGSALRLSGQNTAMYSTLTLSTGSTLIIDVAATHAATAALTLDNGTLTLDGGITLQLNAAEGLAADGRYMLLSGVSAPTDWVSHITVSGGVWSIDDLSWVNNTLYLNYPTLTEATWNNASGDWVWNVDSSVNWEQHELNWAYRNGIGVIFGDEGAGTVSLVGELAPDSVLVDSTKDYTWEADTTESGKLTGDMSLTKEGTGKLTIQTSNSYTGGTEIKGGVLVVDNPKALGTGEVVLNGGTLEIAVTGLANTLANTGTSTLKVSNGKTHSLAGTIDNSGELTLEGLFDATALATVIAQTHIDANGQEGNSGFLKTAGKVVDIMTGSGTLVNNGTVSIGGTTVTLDDKGYGKTGAELQLGTYTIVDGTHSVVAILGKSATAEIVLEAGTLTADASTNALTATGGVINMNEAIELGGSISGTELNVSAGKLMATLEGENALNATDWSMSQAITNNGTLTLEGTVDATTLATAIGETHIDATGQEGNSGFLKTAGKEVDIMTGSGTLVNNGTVSIGGTTVTLDDKGYGKTGAELQLGTYTIVDGTHSVEAILGKSATADINLESGTLTADASTDALTATGGIINMSDAIELGGSISGTELNISAGKLTATLEGANTLNATDWSMSQAITNNGTLTLEGTVDATTLATAIGETHIDATGREGNSGFLKTAGKEVDIMTGSGTLVNNGTVSIDGTTVTLDDKGYGKTGAELQLGTYTIVDGTHSVEAILGKSATAEVVLETGTLTADASTNALTATGGVINMNEAIELGGSISGTELNISSGKLTATLSNTNTLNATGWQMDHTITNNGTLTLEGTVDASALATAIGETHIDATGQEGNSGFLKTAGKEVDIMTGSGTLVNNGTVSIDGTTVTLDDKGYGKTGAELQLGTYTIVDGTHSVEAILRKSATANIILEAGTLTADASTDALTATGGIINMSDAIELGGSISGAVLNVSSGKLTATLSGENTLNATDWSMSQAITNNGTLTLEGTVDASSLATHTEEMLVNTSLSESSSGFLKTAGSSVTIMSGSGTLDTSGAEILVNGQTVTLDERGYGQLGQVINYTQYTINGTDSEFVESIMRAAAGHSASTDIVMNGGELSVNANVTGNLSLTGTAYASVDAAASVFGDVVLDGGTLVLIGNKLTVNGKLDVESATDLLVRNYESEGLFTLISFGSFEGNLSDMNLVEQLRFSSKKTLLTTDDSVMMVVGDKLEWTGGNITAGVLEDMEISYKGDSNTAAEITGSSSVTVDSGVVKLVSDNRYTGGTVVNGGKLIAGHNNAFGSGDVTVNNGGTLDLSTYVVPNKVFMNGLSTLANANGASHIVLGGGSQVSFSNGFTLGSGKTLEVATGGATYTGALTLGGGTLELSDQLIVQGDVVFAAGKQTVIDISGWTAADDGTVLVDFGSSNSGYADGCLTLGGIAGDWELDFNTMTGVLTLVAVKEDFRPNLDRNQQEVYDTMKDIMAGGNPGGVLGQLGQNIIGTRDEAALKRALDEISGREYATIMSSQIEGNLGHLRRLRASAGKGTPLGEYVRPGESVFSNKGVDKSDNKGATVLMAPSPVLDSRRIRAGVSAFHEQGEIESDSNGDGFERSETGAQLTMEYLVGNDFVLGMGLSHSRTKLTPAYGKRRDEDNTHVDLYGVYQSGSWSSTTALGVGLHQHELGRTVAGMQTEAEADGLSVNFLQELAYCVYADEEQGLEVFGAVESSFNKVDSFSESGAGNASLLVDEQDAWATDVTLGLRYNHTLTSLGKAPAGMFTLQGGVVASLGDTNADATVHFAGAPGYGFKQSAAERNRWGYSVGASVNLPVSASTAVFGTAEAVLRNDSYTVDAQVGVKMAF